MSAVVSFVRPGGEPFAAEIGRLIARGATACVHTARVTGPGAARGAEIVVKRAEPGHEDALVHEAAVASKLEHRGIVRLLGTATDAEERPILAFERLGQNPLLAFNGEGARSAFRDPGTFYYPLPPGRAIEFAFDALVALEALHARSHLHGDVKLANLLVRVPDGAYATSELLASVAEGRFEGVLIDQGSVRRVERRPGAALPTTAAEDVPPGMTQLYAPPEALLELSELGGARVFSPAMDIYSFGLVFYVLVSGHLPYELESEVPRDFVLELKLREARGEVTPWLEESLGDLPLHDVAFHTDAGSAWPAFHVALREVFAGCLHPDPRRRFTASALRAKFEKDFKFRPTAPGSVRPSMQGIFQMRAKANRLVGDAPRGGIRVREEECAIVADEAPPPSADETGEGPGFALADHLTQTTVFKAEHKRGTSRFLRGATILEEVVKDWDGEWTGGPVAIVHSGPGPIDPRTGRVFPLEQTHGRIQVLNESAVVRAPRVTVGRAPDNDLVLGDSAVSKRHLVFERTDEGWTVTECGSRNGTLVDDAPLRANEPRLLGPGRHRIAVGPESRLTILAEEDWKAFMAKAPRPKKPSGLTRVLPAARPKPLAEVPVAAPPALPAATPPAELVARLAPLLARSDAREFVLLFEDSILEVVDSPEEALALVRDDPAKVVQVVARTALIEQVLYERRAP